MFPSFESVAGYPDDEAASLDALSLRQQVAGNLYIGAYIEDSLLGARTSIFFVLDYV